MDINELLHSGILEMYCLGVATQEEIQLVKQYANEHAIVRSEIAYIEQTLTQYANLQRLPSASVKEKIMRLVLQEEAANAGLPVLLSKSSSIEEWNTYLAKNNIQKPEGDDQLYMLEFSKTENIVTYIAWARKGAFIEESHDIETERLFMLKGTCKIDFDGTTHYYKEGDVIEIPPNTLHRAEAIGEGVMILIGQRLAA